MKKLAGFTVFLCIFTMLLVPVTVKAAEPYNLGVALGLTGAGALYSADGVEGIKLAVEEINAKGGFLGQHKVELFIETRRPSLMWVSAK